MRFLKLNGIFLFQSFKSYTHKLYCSFLNDSQSVLPFLRERWTAKKWDKKIGRKRNCNVIFRRIFSPHMPRMNSYLAFALSFIYDSRPSAIRAACTLYWKLIVITNMYKYKSYSLWEGRPGLFLFYFDVTCMGANPSQFLSPVVSP
jgi:hypothetical protein